MPQADEDSLRQFGEALARQLMGRPDSWLVERLAEVGITVSKQTVQGWRTGGQEPERARLFTTEKVMGLRPGTLSKLLGYLPVDAVPIRTVDEAVEHDPLLSERGRQVVLRAYRDAVDFVS